MGNEPVFEDLLLDAFKDGTADASSVHACIEAVRGFPEKKQKELGVPQGANDLQLFEWVMRSGGALLLRLENGA
jgi:hypothetical protein